MISPVVPAKCQLYHSASQHTQAVPVLLVCQTGHFEQAVKHFRPFDQGGPAKPPWFLSLDAAGVRETVNSTHDLHSMYKSVGTWNGGANDQTAGLTIHV